MAKAVRLSDIAERAGVSTVSVSKALSGQKGVSDEVRRRIMELADEMGYKKTSAVKKHEETESYNIGVLIHEMYLGKYNSFYLRMYQFVAAGASEIGSFALMEVISHAMTKENEMPKLVQEKKVDGLIVIGNMRNSYLSFLKANMNLPVVFLDFTGEDTDADYVVSDGFYGGYYMTKYLFSKGHEKIAYVGTLGSTSSITDRYLGYERALIEHGQKPREDWQIDDRHPETGKVDEALMKLPEEMPTAFFCNCDTTASQFVRILEEAGYHVPEDVSVVGYDNYLTPGSCEIEITSYEIDMREMARRSVDILIKKLGKEKRRPGISIVSGRLVEKESVKSL